MGKQLSALRNELAVRATNPTPDLRGSENMFGTIATNRFPVNASKDFIPADGEGNIINLTDHGVQAQWLGLDTPLMQYWAYRYCSPLASVIDRIAEADTNGIIQVCDNKGIKIRNYNKIPDLSRVMKLMNNPNPWQTWEDFNAQQVAICKIFGYCIVAVIRPNSMDASYASCMVNFTPLDLMPDLNYEFNIFDKDTSPINEWYGSSYGTEYRFKSKDIIIIKDGFIGKRDRYGLPLSKVDGLDYAVSNICAAMEADNVLLKKKGPLGVFSYDPKPDMAGWTPMRPQDQDDLQGNLRNYGLTLGQLQYIISRVPLKWNPMSFNVRDLMTKETVRQSIDMICDRLSYPAELMSGKNATYENRSSAEKYLYQSNIIPFSLRRMAIYTKFFGFKDYYFEMNYNHLPILQEDILHAGQAARAESESLDIEWKSGMLTWNQWQVIKEREPVAGMDIYYPEWAKNNGIELTPQNKQDVKNTSPKNTGAQE